MSKDVISIERFGYRALVERQGRQDWRVRQPKIGVEYGRFRSRGHAVSAILGHFYRTHAEQLKRR